MVIIGATPWHWCKEGHATNATRTRSSIWPNGWQRSVGHQPSVSNHITLGYDTPSLASHEAPSPPNTGHELCLTSSLVPPLRPLEYRLAYDPFWCDPSQDDSPREDVVRQDVPNTCSKAKPMKQGVSNGDIVAKKPLIKKNENEIKKRGKKSNFGPADAKVSHQAKYLSGQYHVTSCSLRDTEKSDTMLTTSYAPEMI